MSQVSSSANDIKFNNITQYSSTKGSDLNTSSFSKDKLEQSRTHGPSHFVDTHTYLSQIEEKYKQQDIQKKQQNRSKYQKFQYSTGSSQYVMHQGDAGSHITNDNQCVIPEKFKNKTSQVQQPQVQVNVQQPQLQVNVQSAQQSQVISQQNNMAQTGVFNNSQNQGVPVMELNIPDNLSLSRGVSERSYQPVQAPVKQGGIDQ